MYVEMLDACLVKDNVMVVYQCKSESRKLVVDESISCNGFEGFVSDSTASDDSGLSEVEVTYYVQHIVNKILPQYIDQIVRNLSDRFDKQGILSLFRIFVHSCIGSAEKVVNLILEKLNRLLENFEKSLSIEREVCVS